MVCLLVLVLYCNQVVFCLPVQCHGVFFFFALLCSLSVISLFKMALKYDAEELSSASKYKKAVMCFIGKIQNRTHVWNRIFFQSHSCSYSAVDHEFNVINLQCALNKVYLNPNIHKTKFCVGHLTKILAPRVWKKLCFPYEKSLCIYQYRVHCNFLTTMSNESTAYIQHVCVCKCVFQARLLL